MSKIIEHPTNMAEDLRDKLKAKMIEDYNDIIARLAEGDDDISEDDFGLTVSISLVLRDTGEEIHLVCGKPEGEFSFVWHSGSEEGCTICHAEEPDTSAVDFDLTDKIERAQFEQIMTSQQAEHCENELLDDEDDCFDTHFTGCEILTEQPEGLPKSGIGPKVIAFMKKHRGFYESIKADEAFLRMSFKSPKGMVHVLGIFENDELRYEWHKGDFEGCTGPGHGK